MYELGINPLGWSEKTPRPLCVGRPLTEAVGHRKDDLLEIRIAAGDRQLSSQEETVPRRSRRAKVRKGLEPALNQISLFE